MLRCWADFGAPESSLRVETALAKERANGRPVLFPIRLDDAVMGIASGWPALICNTRHIGDFRRWKRHDAYQKAFDRLLRDLRAAETTSPALPSHPHHPTRPTPAPMSYSVSTPAMLSSDPII